jgi:nitroreductase
MPKMSEINVQKSRYFKVADLTEATGQPWAKAQLPVVIESAEIGEYPSDDGKPAEDAFFIYFKGHEKPLGCNLTNRKVLAGIVGNDAEWDTETLAGTHLIVYAEATSMGTGVRLRYDADADSKRLDEEHEQRQRQPKVGNDPVHDDEPPPHTDADAGPPAEDDGEIPF